VTRNKRDRKSEKEKEWEWKGETKRESGSEFLAGLLLFRQWNVQFVPCAVVALCPNVCQLSLCLFVCLFVAFSLTHTLFLSHIFKPFSPSLSRCVCWSCLSSTLYECLIIKCCHLCVCCCVWHACVLLPQQIFGRELDRPNRVQK